MCSFLKMEPIYLISLTFKNTLKIIVCDFFFLLLKYEIWRIFKPNPNTKSMINHKDVQSMFWISFGLDCSYFNKEETAMKLNLYIFLSVQFNLESFDFSDFLI